MIITVFEYAKKFPSKGKVLSPKTIIRRCEDGLLPSDHKARQLPCESGGKGQWVIDIPDEVASTEIKSKPDLHTLNRKHFNFN